MKKKIYVALLIATFTLTSCGSSDKAAPPTEATSKKEETVPQETDQPQSQEDNEAEESTSSNLDALGDIEVEKELFDVTLTIPSDYVGEASQDELDKQAQEYGYKVVLNDDGSATYTMTKSQHKKMLSDLTENINSSLSEMVGSKEYPNITDISANKDFTSFTVTTKSTELDMGESFSVISLYMYGGMYNVFSGDEVDNIHVDFINADTGELITSSDSSDMKSQ